LIRLGEQRHSFDVVRLFDDKRGEHRNGFVELTRGEIEAAEHRRHPAVRVRIGLFKIGDGALRVRLTIGVARRRHFNHARVQAAENPVRFGVQRIGFERALSGGDRVGRTVHARVELGERCGNFRRFGIELLGALIRGRGARGVTHALEMEAEDELEIRAAGFLGRRQLRLRRPGRARRDDQRQHHEELFLHLQSIVPQTGRMCHGSAGSWRVRFWYSFGHGD
jgi:hypothetical protein